MVVGLAAGKSAAFLNIHVEFAKRKCDNKFVSVSALSRDEKAAVNDLCIKLKVSCVHGNSKSTCWNYIGHLYSASQSKVIDESRYYCLPCLESQKAAGDEGHISKVTSFSLSTSTGTISLHLSVKHGIHENDAKFAKIVGYLKKYDASSSSACSSTLSSHEFNRDIALWFCRVVARILFLPRQRGEPGVWGRSPMQQVLWAEPLVRGSGTKPPEAESF